jgi:3-dehydroquinate synthase
MSIINLCVEHKDLSRIVFGEMEAARSFGGTKAVLLVGRHVRGLFHERLPSVDLVIELCNGEAAKGPAALREVWTRMVMGGVDLSWTAFVVGGGAATDAGGFAAATFMRGMDTVLVPTTLMAQVDAAICGKSAINIGSTKNVVGAFHVPKAVVVDVSTLDKLPDSEIASGMAEVVKVAAISSHPFLVAIASVAGDLRPALPMLVEEAVRAKVEVVGGDVRDVAGRRRRLNFGHTLAHALELELRLRHGEAVSVGMAAAARASVEMGMLTQAESDELSEILRRLGLPTSVEVVPEQVWRHLTEDKKRRGEDVDLVLLRRLGRAEIVTLPVDRAEALLRAATS